MWGELWGVCVCVGGGGVLEGLKTKGERGKCK